MKFNGQDRQSLIGRSRALHRACWATEARWNAQLRPE